MSALVASTQAADFHMRPEEIDSPTNLLPWSKTRPAPMALWPTSELPISASLGRPTDVPCAVSRVQDPMDIILSKWGICARCTASPSSRRPQPTPSSTQSTTGGLAMSADNARDKKGEGARFGLLGMPCYAHEGMRGGCSSSFLELYPPLCHREGSNE